MRFVLLFYIALCSVAQADWKIGQQTLALEKCPSGSCLISKDCVSCLALKANQNKQKSDVGPGGTNPGSAVCTKFHKAGIVIAMNDDGGTNAFCRFSDGSLLSLDGLWHW
jgi:hypothetical protein